MKPRIFGNTLYSLRGTAILGAAIALAAALGVYFIAPRLNGHSPAVDSALFGLWIIGILALATVPTCLSSIRVDDTHISHLLLGRVTLSSKPLAELRSVEIGGSIGAILTFEDGSTIRFLGARLEFLRDMCNYLQERCGGKIEVSISPQASAMLRVGGRPRRRPKK